jgi:two-component system sensor histidine kinase YesM
VEDDGKGITEETKIELEEKIYGDFELEQETDWWKQRRSGYALRNIHQRIVIMYGSCFGLTIDNNIEKGVRFSILLPLNFIKSRNLKLKNIKPKEIKVVNKKHENAGK